MSSAYDRAFDRAQARYDNLMPEDMPGYFEHYDDCDGDPENCDCDDRLAEEADEASIIRGERAAEDRAFDAAHDRSWEP